MPLGMWDGVHAGACGGGAAFVPWPLAFDFTFMDRIAKNSGLPTRQSRGRSRSGVACARHRRRPTTRGRGGSDAEEGPALAHGARPNRHYLGSGVAKCSLEIAKSDHQNRRIAAVRPPPPRAPNARGRSRAALTVRPLSLVSSAGRRRPHRPGRPPVIRRCHTGAGGGGRGHKGRALSPRAQRPGGSDAAVPDGPRGQLWSSSVPVPPPRVRGLHTPEPPPTGSPPAVPTGRLTQRSWPRPPPPHAIRPGVIAPWTEGGGGGGEGASAGPEVRGRRPGPRTAGAARTPGGQRSRS